MINLLQETLNELESFGKSEKDILCVIGVIPNPNDYREVIKVKLSWEDFKEYANVTYNNGFGSTVISPRLKICGIGFWLERDAYDGSEWWELKEYPSLEDYKITNNVNEISQMISLCLTNDN